MVVLLILGYVMKGDLIHMTRLLAFLLALMMCLTFTACKDKNKDDTEEKDDIHIEGEMQFDNKKAPSEATILNDLGEKLLDKNEFVNLTNVTTVKSLTDDGYFSVTLEVQAASDYTDWVYEVELEYTKYDQGWMLDNASWLSEEYTIARVPTLEVITELANNVDKSEVNFGSMLPVSNATIDTDDTLETGILWFTWSFEEEYPHVYQTTVCTTKWSYDVLSDEWKCIPYDESSGEAKLIYNVTPKDVDFSGEWTGSGFVSTIIIEDFSWDGFTVTVDGESSYYRSIYGHPKTSEKSFGWFSDGSNYIHISSGPRGSSIQLLSIGQRSTTQIFYGSLD